jgi:hypothetical protein
MDFEPPLCLRGFLTGFDSEELGELVDQWLEVKKKQAEEDARFLHCFPFKRSSRVKTLHPLPDLKGAEDIRMFFESCHQDEVEVPSGPELAALVERIGGVR